MVAQLGVFLDERDSLLNNELTQREALALIPDTTMPESLLPAPAPSGLGSNLSVSRADLADRPTSPSRAPSEARPAPLVNAPHVPSQLLAPALSPQDLPLATSQFSAGAGAAHQASGQNLNATFVSGASRKPLSSGQPAAGAAPGLPGSGSPRQGRRREGLEAVAVPSQPLQANPYLALVNFDDVLALSSPEDRGAQSVAVLEALLRCHGDAKTLYAHFQQRYMPESGDADGQVLRREGLWRLLREMRLETARASVPALNRFFARGRKNAFPLRSHPKKLALLVAKVQQTREAAGAARLEAPGGPAELREESFEDGLEEERESKRDKTDRANQLDQLTRSMSLDVDVLDLMRPPADFPEVRPPDQFPEFEAAHLLERPDPHEPAAPLLFRHFVDALFRLALLRAKHNLLQAVKGYEELLRKHIPLVVHGKKVPKPIIHDELLVAEKLLPVLNSPSGQKLLGLVQALRELNVPARSYGAEAPCLTLEMLLRFLRVGSSQQHNGVDIATRWPLLLSVLDSKTDPEESVKAIDNRIQELASSPQTRTNSRVGKYNSQKARLLNLKKGFEMLDEDWTEVLATFAVRQAEVYGKDKKFEAKATKAVDAFAASLTNLNAKRKPRPARVFPVSRKDYEFRHIADLKKLQKAERRKLAQRAQEKEQEKRERLEMKMEDYDAEVRPAKTDETEEFSDGDSAGGQSMYVYKESREATPLPAAANALGFRHSRHASP